MKGIHFRGAKGLITRRISAQAEILLRLYDELQPGLNSLCGAKCEIARKESQENQNGAKNTNRENRHIASLAVCSTFQLGW